MRYVGLDIETTGLDPFNDTITLVTIAYDDGCTLAYHLPETLAEVDHELSALYSRRADVTLVLHNSPFDLPFLDIQLGVGIPERVHDTQVAEQLLTAGLGAPHCTLASLAEKYLGITLDKSIREGFIGNTGELTRDQVDYAKRDAEVLLPIAKKQLELIEAAGLLPIWEIESAVTPVFCHMKRWGIRLDPDRLNPVIRQAEAELELLRSRLLDSLTYHVQALRIARFDAGQAERNAYQSELEEVSDEIRLHWAYGGRENFPEEFRDETVDKDGQPKGLKRYLRHELKEWRKEHPRPPKPKFSEMEPIDLNSPLQLKAALESLLKKGIPDTGIVTLKRLLAESEGEAQQVLSDLVAYRDKAKLVQAFGEKLVEKIAPDGMVHPDYTQYGTHSGRPTSSSPNVLQIPAKDALRRAFIPRDGYRFVICDYSQMELRILAELSGDSGMISTYRNGEDIHRKTGQDILQRAEITEHERKVAKVCNFAISYGGEAGTIRTTLAKDGTFISQQEAESFISGWRRQRKQAWRFITEKQNQAVKMGYTSSALGRKRNFALDDSQKQGSVKRAGANHVIQATNADITKIAMAVIHQTLLPVGGRVVLNVYDEVVAEIPKAYADWAKCVVETAMLEAARLVLKVVPAAVDACISTSWAESDQIEGDV